MSQPTTIYFAADLHRWLKRIAFLEETSLSILVNRACQEYRVRAELAAAAAGVETDPAALTKIQNRTKER